MAIVVIVAKTVIAHVRTAVPHLVGVGVVSQWVNSEQSVFHTALRRAAAPPPLVMRNESCETDSADHYPNDALRFVILLKLNLGLRMTAFALR